jgi:hypothetical protein
MSDVSTDPSIPDPAPPAAPQGTLPGTQIGIPVGTGVEGLTAVVAPFRTNSPPWYTPKGTVWAAMGCAVPQAGRYIQTNNNVIFETINEMGKALFEILWKYPDRTFDRSPSRDCLWQVYSMLLDARKRMANNSYAPNETPTLAVKYTTAPEMFTVYPVPFYGALGCPNQWLHRLAEMTFAAMTEAMQHDDNELSFHTTKDFFNTVWGPLGFMLADMAWRFFGIDRKTATDIAFTIPDAAWTTFDGTKTGQDNGATSVRPPMGYHPTNLDLEAIRGLPYSQVVGFLQPWPSSTLLYSSGGIWMPTSVANTGDGSGAENSGSSLSDAATGVRASLAPTGGPPSA